MAPAGEKVKSAWTDLCSALNRTKTLDLENIAKTQLNRCLNIFDLVALGVGSTLGAGLYVLATEAAKTEAGPAVVLSFLIGGVASLMSGLCYAEFAGRVPRAGSAYLYSYVSVGEAWAFVIGWNMLLEGIIGGASVSRAWSQYLDSLFNDTIRSTIVENVGTFDATPALGDYPDFLSFGLLIVMTLMISLGVKMSAVITTFLTVINLAVVVSIIIVGSFYADGKNWTDDLGFFPFGFNGVMAGAATCFYAFVGFDAIATSGEEARNPTRAIPVAIMITLLVCFLAYFGVSTVVTLVVPWYDLADSAALPKMFSGHDLDAMEYVIAVGGLCGLSSSLIGSLFPVPRIIYSLASDGLIFRFLGTIHPKTNTPFLGTWVAGVMAACLALLIDLAGLVQMMSIGTLMAYTMVAISVLMLRYRRETVGLLAVDVYAELEGETRSEEMTSHKSKNQMNEDTGLLETAATNGQSTKYTSSEEGGSGQRESAPEQRKSTREALEDSRSKREQEVLDRMAAYMIQSHDVLPHSNYQRLSSNYSLSSLAQLFNVGEGNKEEPTEKSRRIASASIFGLTGVWIVICIIGVYGSSHVLSAEWWAIVLLGLLGAVFVLILLILARQPRNRDRLNFTVPFVPLVPLISIMVNVYMMVALSPVTWIRFAVWLALGAAIYFGYGLRNSAERLRSGDQEIILRDVSSRDVDDSKISHEPSLKKLA